MVWKYDIDYTLIGTHDALYFAIATIGRGNRARSPEVRRKYVKPRAIACGAKQVC